MGKKRAGAAMSKHIKTRHKRTAKTPKPVTHTEAIRDINKAISKQIDSQPKPDAETLPAERTIELETITMENFKKLTGNPDRKQKLGKLSVDDVMYLEKLLKRWGTNYARMAQDVRLNKMQWTAQQIEKKHETYKKMFPQLAQQPAQ